MASVINGWDIVLMGMSIALLVGALPAMICFAIRYAVHLHHIVLKKRYSRIVFWEIIIFITLLLFDSSVFVAMIISERDIESLPVTISLLGANIAEFLLYSTWVWRFYLLMYDISWITAAKNDHWQNIINPTYKDSIASWFISNKKKWGNTKWTFFHLFVPLLIIGTLLQDMSLILSLLKVDQGNTTRDLLNIMDYIIGCVPLILLIIIYCKIPSFQDKFFIHQELKNILIAISVQYIAFFGTVSIRLTKPNSLSWVLTYFVSILCEFAAMGFATIWVATKVESIIHSQLYHIRKFESKSNKEYVSIDSPRNNNFTSTVPEHASSSILLANNHGHKGTESKLSLNRYQYTLEQLLQNEQAFPLFMVQLSHEFSQEILLSFIEMIQYQQLIAQYININNLNLDHLSINQSQYGYNYANREYYETIKFPPNVPKSIIIYGPYRRNSHSLIEDFDIYCNEHEFIDRLKLIVWKIYDKYISNDAQFQINVPYTCQRAIQKLIQNRDNFFKNNHIQLTQLLHLFDDCIFEVYSLMMDTYGRFSKTQRYMTLHALIHI